jgi:hypothetical protein
MDRSLAKELEELTVPIGDSLGCSGWIPALNMTQALGDYL